MVYTTMAVAAAVGLIWRIKVAHAVAASLRGDRRLLHAAALVTGALWGKPMWGTYWEWDPRLTSELILLFLIWATWACARLSRTPSGRTGRVQYWRWWAWSMCRSFITRSPGGIPSIRPLGHEACGQSQHCRLDAGAAADELLGFTLLFGALLLVRLRAEILTRERAAAGSARHWPHEGVSRHGRLCRLCVARLTRVTLGVIALNIVWAQRLLPRRGPRRAAASPRRTNAHDPHRRHRLYLVLGILAGVSIAAALALNAFRQQRHLLFHPDCRSAAGDVPGDQDFRLGGMVTRGKPEARPGQPAGKFVRTDFNHNVPVSYDKVLPDLFREGQGVVAYGRLDGDGMFVADEVLAKHDEKYMPPEVAKSLKRRHGESRTETRALRPRGQADPDAARTGPLRTDPGAAAGWTAGVLRHRAARCWAATAGARPRHRRVAGQFVMVATAVGILVVRLRQHTISRCLYVAENSNSALPLFYRVAALWGAHEGSLLLWIFLLAVWTRRGGVRLAQPAGALRGARARGARATELRLPAVYAGHLRPVPAPDPGGGRWSRPEPASCRTPGSPSIRRCSTPVTSGFAVAFAFACAAMLEGRMDQTGRAGRAPGRPRPGLSSPAASRWAAGGRTTSWAGAATGCGTRWRTPRSCRGWWAPR